MLYPYPSIPFFYRPDIFLVPDSTNKSLSYNKLYVEVVQTTIDQVLEVFFTKRLPFDPFKMTLQRNRKSGITYKAGFYLILNIKTDEIYIGETLNLAARKSTYMQGSANTQSAKIE